MSKNNVTLATVSNINRLTESYKFVYQIKANFINEDWLNYHNHLFITERLHTHKSDIANLILNENVICLSYHFLKKYILEAQNSNNGFKKAALEVVLKNILPTENWEFDLASSLWEKLNQQKDHIREFMEQKVDNGLFFFNTNDINVVINNKNDLNNVDLIVLKLSLSELT
ncbi:hypothetical protein [Paenibacillus sp. BIC5C1]|uniref:hypothetical protein n=1 Tax=Paenibacillus sp. BIC5C1 TaxID=3078263 RepID=UPI0028E513E7|nr:hypothetical protein [Paenibacillus sp. BIC5C1]